MPTTPRECTQSSRSCCSEQGGGLCYAAVAAAPATVAPSLPVSAAFVSAHRLLTTAPLAGIGPVRRPLAACQSIYDLRRKAIAATLRRMANDTRRGTQLLRGVLDLCLLAVMDEAPAYGYEMTKRLRSRGLSLVGEGSIYPLLGRLERDGLVDTYRAASDGGPPRKYYRASPDGHRALEAGVSEWQAARDAVDAVLGLVETEVQS
jgi:PadR family transcriptional regulator PadR